MGGMAPRCGRVRHDGVDGDGVQAGHEREEEEPDRQARLVSGGERRLRECGLRLGA